MKLEYNHSHDLMCNFADFFGPITNFMIIIGVVFLFGLGIVILYTNIRDGSDVFLILLAIFAIILPVYIMHMLIKDGGNTYPFRVLLEHILFFSITDKDIFIKYTEDGFFRKNFRINKNDIYYFLVSYFDVKRDGKGGILWLTMEIEIKMKTGRCIKIRSRGNLTGLIRFLKKVNKFIPNYSCYDELITRPVSG